MPPSNTGTSRFKLILSFAILYVVWSSTYLAIRFAIETIPPFLMGGLRSVLAGLLLLIVLYWRKSFSATPRQWRNASIAGFLMIVGGNGGVVWAEQRVPSGLTALLLGTTPLWMVFIDWVWGSRMKPTWKQGVGMGFGFLGVFLLVGPEYFAGGNRVDPWGFWALLLATVAWSFGSIFARQSDMPPSPYSTAAVEMFSGGVALFLLGLCVGEPSHLVPALISTKSLISMLYLILFGSLACFSAYAYLLKHSTPAKVSTYSYINPVGAVLLGWAFAGEPVSIRTVLSAISVLVGVVVVTMTQPKKTFTPPGEGDL